MLDDIINLMFRIGNVLCSKVYDGKNNYYYNFAKIKSVTARGDYRAIALGKIYDREHDSTYTDEHGSFIVVRPNISEELEKGYLVHKDGKYMVVDKLGQYYCKFTMANEEYYVEFTKKDEI